MDESEEVPDLVEFILLISLNRFVNFSICYRGNRFSFHLQLFLKIKFRYIIHLDYKSFIGPSGRIGYPSHHKITRQIAEAANREKLRKTLFTNLRLNVRECVNFDIPLTLSVLADVMEHMTKLIGGVVPLVEVRSDDRVYPEAPSNDFRDVKLVIAEIIDGPMEKESLRDE